MHSRSDARQWLGYRRHRLVASRVAGPLSQRVPLVIFESFTESVQKCAVIPAVWTGGSSRHMACTALARVMGWARRAVLCWEATSLQQEPLAARSGRSSGTTHCWSAILAVVLRGCRCGGGVFVLLLMLSVLGAWASDELLERRRSKMLVVCLRGRLLWLMHACIFMSAAATMRSAASSRPFVWPR
jgi:hypothetical protein